MSAIRSLPRRSSLWLLIVTSFCLGACRPVDPVGPQTTDTPAPIPVTPTPLPASPTPPTPSPAAPTTTPEPETPTPQGGETASPACLVTPVAEQPAAGICVTSEEETITLHIHPDIPDPRCAQVRPDQGLRVINHLDQAIQVSLACHQMEIRPGAEGVFQAPVGAFLSAGVHRLEVSPCCGPEIWVLEAQ